MKGFTLIELLVVLAIIGILFGIVITSTNAVKKNARDGQRQSDLSQIQSALQSFYADHSYYPTSLNLGNCNLLGCNGIVYIKAIPTDPLPGNSNYLYQAVAKASCNTQSTDSCSCDNSFQASNCNAYNLCARLENSPSGSSTVCGQSYNFEVNQPQ